MSWTPEDMEDDAAVSVWAVQQKSQRRKKVGIGFGIALAALAVTWVFTQVMSISARAEIQKEQWLKDNGCLVMSRKDSDMKYHFFGDYWEYIPGEVCYKCSNTGESFCEDD